MHKSKVKPISKLVCKGDAFALAPKILVRGFTNLKGPHTCLIDLLSARARLGSDGYLYNRIAVQRPPMDIKEKSSRTESVRDQNLLSASHSSFSLRHNLFEILTLSSAPYRFNQGFISRLKPAGAGPNRRPLPIKR